MEIIIAKNAGFCMGVRRAVNSVMELANSKKFKDISVLGPLIHNRQVNEMLKKRDIKIANHINEVASGVCVVRTHGISPQKKGELRSREIEIFDATCPRVLEVQSVIERHSKRGFFIVIVGDKGHAEVEGLLGFTEGKGLVVDSADKVAEIPRGQGRICVVAQTTQNHEEYKKIVSIIKERFSDCVVFDTICGSTSDRQKEVIEMSKTVDAFVIVGGKESANTMRLVEIAKSTGLPTYHVETGEDIIPGKFLRYKKIGISAGASTPNIIVHNVAAALRRIRHLPTDHRPPRASI